MTDCNDYCVILTTCASKQEAEKLAGLLVEQRLAACVQLTSITSFYRWKEAINRDAEELLLIKARRQRYQEIEAAIVANHSYEVPEIVVLPIAQGLSKYFAWINEVTE